MSILPCNKNFKSKIYSYLPICLILCFPTLNAQKRYLFHNYNINEGLANNFILSINQDRYGYIWLGTDAGVSRFDGYKFDNRVIPELNDNSAFVEYIEKNQAGNLIMTGFMEGIHVQQANGTFKQYLLEPKQIGKNCPNTIKAWTKNRILVGLIHQLCIFENGKFKSIYNYGADLQVIMTIESDTSENIWFGGCLGLAAISSKDPNYTPVFLPELKNRFILKIIFDKKGDLSIGTTQGFFKLIFNKPGYWKKGYKIYQPFPELANTSINNLYFDRYNNLWMATSANGFFKIQNNKIVENITSINGLPSEGAMCIFQDNENNYWFGTNDGVCKLSDFNKYAIDYNDKKLNNIGTIKKDNFGRIWLADDANLFILKNNKVEKILSKNSLITEGGINEFLIDPSQTLWIANHNGLFSLQINEQFPDLKRLKQKVDFKSIGTTRIEMLKYLDGKIWLGFENRLYVYDQNKLLACDIKLSEVSKIQPNCIVRDSFGYYWLGDFNGGLYRMKLTHANSNKLEFDSIKVYKSLKPDSAFVTAWGQDLLIDHEGNLWFASLHTGVYKFKLYASGISKVKLYSTKNGLSSNYVTQLIEDKKHRIWFGTLKGADCLIKKTKDDEKIIHYNKKDGLGTENDAILPDSEMVYLVFSDGLFVVENKSTNMVNPITNNPNIFITGISVNGLTDSLGIDTNKPIKYLHNQNNISFEFISVTFKQGNATQYQYILEGTDKTWSNFTDRRYVSYNSLPPGRYTFKVKAKSEEGIVSKQEATLAFIIIPPFYETWWFILILALIGIFIAYFIYNYRIKQLLKLEKLRSRIASDLHDDIGSTLSSISILSEILSAQNDNTSGSKEMIGKIGSSARNMLESMDDIIWAVNPANDKFQNLDLRIREYAIPLFELKNIKFNIYFSEELAMIQLPMDIRRNVYLIAKESINNLIKYSDCQLAEIEFKEHNSNLVMIVQDNGRGFDTSISGTRNGLKNMKRRADQIRAEIEISSGLGKGTRISLQVKIM
jgi:ligand-binding sensor domain-containing protein/two-component sensor histidine kinase